MLLGTVLLWALNITVTKYMFDHGWKPLAYGTIRYFVAISLFWAFTYYRERSFRIARADLLARRGRRADDLPQPALLRLRREARACLDRRAPARHDADLHRPDRACAAARAPAGPVLDRRRDHVRRSRSHRRRERQRRLEPRRHADFDRHRVHVGLLHDRDRAADAPVLAVPHQLRRPRDRVGAARARRDPADPSGGSSRSAGRSGSGSVTR